MPGLQPAPGSQALHVAEGMFTALWMDVGKGGMQHLPTHLLIYGLSCMIKVLGQVVMSVPTLDFSA